MNIKEALIISRTDLKNIFQDITFAEKTKDNMILITLKTKKMREAKTERTPFFSTNTDDFIVIIENTMLWECIKIFRTEKTENKLQSFDLDSIWNK